MFYVAFESYAIFISVVMFFTYFRFTLQIISKNNNHHNNDLIQNNFFFVLLKNSGIKLCRYNCKIKVIFFLNSITK